MCFHQQLPVGASGMWMKNMKEKLGTMYSTSEFRREFDVLVNGMMTMHV
jgi:hypothetical protein